MLRRILVTLLLGLTVVAGLSIAVWWKPTGQATLTSGSHVIQPRQREPKGQLHAGLPIYIRIFKQESELELWMRKDGAWELYSQYPICAWSGKLGPKLKEGDKQSPEGFYAVTKASLNPNSSYHLSFNLGFPNAYDRSFARTGSFLMVHGECVSIGCYAMTNPGIEAIYRMVEAALDAGQPSVPVHVFPFRMSAENMTRHAGSEWIGFWRGLKSAFDYFEAERKVPAISVLPQRYVVNPAS